MMVFVAFGLSVAAFAGCGSSVKIPENQPEAEALEQANALFAQGKYEEALERFLYVKDHFLRSENAGVTRFYAGECYFAMEKYEDASVEYQSFLTFFPNDQLSAEAQYKLGAALVEKALGPERDQTDINEALTELEVVLEKYGENQAVAQKAEEKIAIVKDKLAKHEYLVAKFYRREKRFEASNNRLNYLFENFPASALNGDALLMSAQNYQSLGQTDKAKDAYSRFVRDYPAHEQAKEARKQLAKFGETNIPQPQVQPQTPPKETPAAATPAALPPLREGYVVLTRDQQVFINLIAEDGIQQGMKLDVYRGQQRVGAIRMIDVQGGFSIGEIESLAPGMTIQEEDRVILSRE